METVQEVSQIGGTVEENLDEPIAPATSTEHEKNSENQRSHARGRKHQISHPLTNVLCAYQLILEMVTRSKIRNIIAFSSYISMVEPKSIKKAFGDADCIVFMQEELNQFKRNKV